MKQANRQSYWNWFLISIFFAYQYLLRVYPSTFTNDIRHTFGFSAKDFATLSTYCIFVYSCLQIPFGILLDRINVRWLILCAFGMCLGGQYMFTHTTSPEWAQWGRILIGIGSAPAFMGAVKIASDSFSDKLCGIFIGITCALATIFVILGNSLLKHLSLTCGNWQEAAGYLNIFGMVLFILCLLTLSVQDKEAQGEVRNDFWKTFLSVVLNYRIFIYALLTIGICATVTTLSDLWGNAFLITKYQLSETQAVLYNQFMFAGSLLGSFLVPLIFSGGHKVLLGVRVCCWSVAALFAVLIYATNQIPGFALQSVLFFLGFFAYGDVLCFALAAQLSTPKTSGLIVGWVNTINMIGLTLLQMFVGHSLDEYWNGTVNAHGLRLYQASDYELALGLLLNVALICGFISFFIRTKKVRG